MTTYPFYTQAGWLTKYALACGYIERDDSDDVQTTLWLEGGVYHVRQHDFNTHRRVFWDTFNKLSEARKRYIEAIT